MEKAIVLGAGGFVGSCLVRTLAEQGINVYAVSTNVEKLINKIGKLDNVTPISCELSTIDMLTEKIGCRDIDVFYNLAWAGTAGSARFDIPLQLKNVEWTCNSVSVAKKLGCKRFVGAGSIMEIEVSACVDEDGSMPGSAYIYASGKIAAHQMSKITAANLKIDHLWPMITNAYGEGEFSPRFINTTIRKMIAAEALQFTSGTQNYDFIHIEDVARAFYLIGEHGKSYSKYLIGSGKARPLKEFIIEMQQTLAPEQELSFGDIPFTGVNIPLSVFECGALEADTGFKPSIAFADGVKRTMDWIRKTDLEENK